MCFYIYFRIHFTELRRSHDHSQNPGYTFLDITANQCFIKIRISSCSNWISLQCCNHTILCSSRHYQVISCMHHGVNTGSVSCTPVCHDHTVKSPFTAWDRCQQIKVFACISSVYFVVRAHDRHRLSRFYNHFETFQVDFS